MMLRTGSFDLLLNSTDVSVNSSDRRTARSTPQIKEVHGSEFLHLEKDRAIKTYPDETTRRRAVRLNRHIDESWGFALQTYGLRNKRTEEVEVMSYVDYIEKGSAAWIAGMRKGDIILSVNGESVELCTHKELVKKIKSSGCHMRLVVLFEDCCRKVALHERYLQLKKLLAHKLKELHKLEFEEKRISHGLSWSGMEYFQCSSCSSTSSHLDEYNDRVSPAVLEHLPINTFAFREYLYNDSTSNLSTEISNSECPPSDSYSYKLMMEENQFSNRNNESIVSSSFDVGKKSIISSNLDVRINESLDSCSLEVGNDESKVCFSLDDGNIRSVFDCSLDAQDLNLCVTATGAREVTSLTPLEFHAPITTIQACLPLSEKCLQVENGSKSQLEEITRRLNLKQQVEDGCVNTLIKNERQHKGESDKSQEERGRASYILPWQEKQAEKWEATVPAMKRDTCDMVVSYGSPCCLLQNCMELDCSLTKVDSFIPVTSEQHDSFIPVTSEEQFSCPHETQSSLSLNNICESTSAYSEGKSICVSLLSQDMHSADGEDEMNESAKHHLRIHDDQELSLIDSDEILLIQQNHSSFRDLLHYNYNLNDFCTAKKDGSDDFSKTCDTSKALDDGWVHLGQQLFDKINTTSNLLMPETLDDASTRPSFSDSQLVLTPSHATSDTDCIVANSNIRLSNFNTDEKLDSGVLVNDQNYCTRL